MLDPWRYVCPDCETQWGLIKRPALDRYYCQECQDLKMGRLDKKTGDVIDVNGSIII